MNSLISTVVALVLVGTGIAIMIGQITPEEVFRRFVSILALALVACGIIVVLNQVVLPVLVSSLQSTLIFALKAVASVLALALIGFVVVALVSIARRQLRRRLPSPHNHTEKE